MELSNYVTIGADGKPQFDTAKFNADLDRERTNASNTSATNTEQKLRKTLEAELRQKIEEEAKLSSEEKLKKEREEFDAFKLEQEKALKEARLSFNRERLIGVYTANNAFSKEEAEMFCKLATEDYTESEKVAKKLVEERTKQREAYKQSILQEIQSKSGVPNGSGTQPTDSDVVKRAKLRNEKLSQSNIVEF